MNYYNILYGFISFGEGSRGSKKKDKLLDK